MKELFEYKREMDKLEPDQVQKDALVATLLKEQSAPVGHGKHRYVGRTALVAACLVGVLVVGASATGLLKTAVQAFSGVFGETPAVTQVVDKIGRPVGASDTDNGITITADAIIGEKDGVAVIYTISRDDGSPFDLKADENGHLNVAFREFEYGIPFERGLSGNFWFLDVVPGDNEIQLFTNERAFGAQAAIKQGSVKAQFKDFYCYNPETQEEYSIADGEWKLNYELNFVDCSTTLNGGGQFVLQNGTEITVDKIVVSPLGVHANYFSSSFDVDDFGRLLPAVTLTDGTVLDPEDMGNGSNVSNDDDMAPYPCSASLIFDRLIPLDQIKSVTVGGIEISVH